MNYCSVRHGRFCANKVEHNNQPFMESRKSLRVVSIIFIKSLVFEAVWLSSFKFTSHNLSKYGTSCLLSASALETATLSQQKSPFLTQKCQTVLFCLPRTQFVTCGGGFWQPTVRVMVCTSPLVRLWLMLGRACSGQDFNIPLADNTLRLFKWIRFFGHAVYVYGVEVKVTSDRQGLDINDLESKKFLFPEI